MNKVSVQIIPLVLLILISCSYTKKKTFSVYEADTDNESMVNNHVKYYLAFEYIEGQWVKKDSVSLDEKGNIISVINKRPVFGEKTFFYYDSLNRLIYEIQRSDILTKVCTRYELIPEKETIIKHVSFCDSANAKGEIVELIELKFDKNLEQILKETEVNVYNHDTTVTHYEYFNCKLQKAITIKNGQEFMNAEYIYDNDRLIKVSRASSFDYNSTAFISKDTGLTDSTLQSRDGMTWVTRYKYFQ